MRNIKNMTNLKVKNDLKEQYVIIIGEKLRQKGERDYKNCSEQGK